MYLSYFLLEVSIQILALSLTLTAPPRKIGQPSPRAFFLRNLDEDSPQAQCKNVFIYVLKKEGIFKKVLTLISQHEKRPLNSEQGVWSRRLPAIHRSDFVHLNNQIWPGNSFFYLDARRA